MVVYVCNPNTWEMETESQEFKTDVCYKRPFLKHKNKTKNVFRKEGREEGKKGEERKERRGDGKIAVSKGACCPTT